MLHSGVIKEYIENDSQLVSDNELSSIVEAVKIEEFRINKGTF